MIRVVGLDLSLTSIGYCQNDGVALTFLSKLRGVPRLTDLRGQIAQRVDAFGPDLVVIEDYGFASRVGHVHERGELGGVVKVYMAENNHRVVLIAPAALKKFATNKGNADKVKMAVAAAKLGREFDNDDVCDAWWLLQMGVYRFGGGNRVDAEHAALWGLVPQTSYRDEVVSKIDWPAIPGVEAA